MTAQARGNVTIDVEECKGCGLCVESCPPECLELAPELNPYGVHPAHYTGRGLHRLRRLLLLLSGAGRHHGVPAGAAKRPVASQQRGGDHAAAL